MFLTQPLGGGRVEDFSFARVLDEARRVAAYLRSLDLPPGSHVAIASKNCAWFFVADLAIWMAGHVSVALYPTLDAPTARYILEHAEAKLLFVGKLDGWDELAKGVPDGLPCVALPLAPETRFPRWKTVLERFAPIPDLPRRRPDEWAAIFYTSGTTGRPKGVVHTFETMSIPAHGLIALLDVRATDRYLSYLPLAHVMERWLGECIPLVVGAHVFFAESVETFVDDLRTAQGFVMVLTYGVLALLVAIPLGQLGSNWFWYFNSPFGCHIEMDADMDQHDASWQPREATASADNSQTFLMKMRKKWYPGPGIPENGDYA